MPNELFIEILRQARGVWRHRWVAVSAAWIFAMVGWGYVSMIPNEYQASARLFVDTQSMLRPLLQGLAVQPDFSERVVMMSKVLLSRPNLEKVIRMSDLELGIHNENDRLNLVEELSKTIQIRAEGRGSTYTISYQNKSPDVAIRVVQSLVTIFVEEALAGSQSDTSTAQDFLDQEIADYESTLRQSELRLADFQRKNAGLLPGENGYYATLEQTKAALKDATLALDEAIQRRDRLIEQLKGSAPADSSWTDPRVVKMEEHLNELLLRFTERHPDVIELRKLISDYKRRSSTNLDGSSRGQPAAPVEATTVYGSLQIALNEAEAQVASLQARVNDYKARVTELTGKIDSIPRIEAELTQLTREYNTISAQHTKLVQRRESARLSQQFEKTTEGLKFRVIDPPYAPSSPSAPNRFLLAAAVFLVAIGGGAGLAFVLNQYRPVYDDRNLLYRSTGLPVFGVVTLIQTTRQHARDRTQIILLLSLVIGLLIGSVIVGTGLPARFLIE